MNTNYVKCIYFSTGKYKSKIISFVSFSLKIRMKSFTVLVSTLTVTLASVHSEEAPYEVTQAYDEWEVRHYPPTKWISTDAQDVRPTDGSEHDLVLSWKNIF